MLSGCSVKSCQSHVNSYLRAHDRSICRVLRRDAHATTTTGKFRDFDALRMIKAGFRHCGWQPGVQLWFCRRLTEVDRCDEVLPRDLGIPLKLPGMLARGTHRSQGIGWWPMLRRQGRLRGLVQKVPLTFHTFHSTLEIPGNRWKEWKSRSTGQSLRIRSRLASASRFRVICHSPNVRS